MKADKLWLIGGLAVAGLLIWARRKPANAGVAQPSAPFSLDPFKGIADSFGNIGKGFSDLFTGVDVEYDRPVTGPTPDRGAQPGDGRGIDDLLGL